MLGTVQLAMARPMQQDNLKVLKVYKTTLSILQYALNDMQNIPFLGQNNRNDPWAHAMDDSLRGQALKSLPLTLRAASPHFSMAARPWLWMCVSRSFFSSPKPSVMRETRLYMRPRSKGGEIWKPYLTVWTSSDTRMQASHHYGERRTQW